jgi:hypothetical protein
MGDENCQACVIEQYIEAAYDDRTMDAGERVQFIQDERSRLMVTPHTCGPKRTVRDGEA